MATRSVLQSLPSWTVFACLVLALYHSAVFRPLSRRVAERDRPLTNVWNQLVATNLASEACGDLNLENFAARQERLELLATNLAAIRRLVQQRLEPCPEVRARLAEPWQLVEFLNERLRQAEQLSRLAKEKGVAFDPQATEGLPDYTAELTDRELLWPRLHVATQLLLTAIHCQAAAVRLLQQLPSVSHHASSRDPNYVEEMPMRMELVGSMQALSRFLTALPLQGADLQAVGLAAALTNKPIVFIDRVLARKLAPDRPDDVLLELTVSGFVPWTDERRRSLAF